MLSELKTKDKVIGVKQSLKAVRAGQAAKLFFAGDADPSVLEPIAALCAESAVPTVWTASMAELGKACGIDVGASVVTLLKE